MGNEGRTGLERELLKAAGLPGMPDDLIVRDYLSTPAVRAILARYDRPAGSHPPNGMLADFCSWLQTKDQAEQERFVQWFNNHLPPSVGELERGQAVSAAVEEVSAAILAVPVSPVGELDTQLAKLAEAWDDAHCGPCETEGCADFMRSPAVQAIFREAVPVPADRTLTKTEAEFIGKWLPETKPREFVADFMRLRRPL